ncbi:MAG TPA: SGNH/GDSL hydrolase family protein [Gammaproteobacteria bacterium]
MTLRLPIAAALLLVNAVALAQGAWVGTWGASPVPPRAAGAGPFPATPSFSDVTIRQIVRLSAGGDQVRLRLTNEYGTAPLEIGAARIAIANADGELEPATERVVRFGGATSAVIPPGAPLVSDPVDLAVDELEILSVSLYFPSDTGPCTCHPTGMQTAFVSAPGDHTSGTFEPADTIQSRAFLSGIAVRSDDAAGVVVAFGDSITDGVGSTPGANHRWPDYLAARLAARPGAPFGVVNHGISGNRVLADGAGQSALARFDRDVLSVPGLTHVIVFEGVNDLGIGFGNFGGQGGRGGAFPQGVEVSAESIIAGYRQLIARAHAKGLKIYGATIAPYEGAGYFSEDGEAARQAINDWIRESGEFDAVLDFDAVLRDPEKPSQIAEGMHAGDFLHGSDAGYEAMAESIDLSLFR